MKEGVLRVQVLPGHWALKSELVRLNTKQCINDKNPHIIDVVDKNRLYFPRVFGFQYFCGGKRTPQEA
jgi:hypothetical protein